MNITQAAGFLGAEVTFGGQGDGQPFLSLPTSCPKNPLTGEPEPLQTTVEGDSWASPGNPPMQLPLLNTAPMPALDGCNRLPLSSEIKVTPDVQEASKPSGLKVDVHVPQEEALNAAGLAPAA